MDNLAALVWKLRADMPTASIPVVLETAFAQFDQALLRLLLDPTADKRPALAGACVLMVIVDGLDLYVANTGDCRAILAQKLPHQQGWTALDLTVDQTLHNPLERQRVLAEHPGEDPAVLTARNRILGGLEPSRAFGDAKYKVSVDMHQLVVSKLLGPRSMRPGYKTPPYVTAQPVITHHRLDPARDQCLVMATDGLWGELSSAQVAHLLDVHAQIFHPLQTEYDTDDDRRSVHSGPGVAVVDVNPATHLLRNALGGSDHTALMRQIGTAPPHARKIRDDITNMVVYFDKSTL